RARAARRASIRGGRVRGVPAGRRRAMKARLSTDGGARGNPGPAAYGFGLEKALELGVDEVEVVSDSELLVKQMTGEYRVKNEALRELSLRAAALARQLGRVSYRAVRREHNELADRLVNEALDRA